MKEVYALRSQNASWRRAVLAGIVATLVFSLLLGLAPLIGSPRINVPLWDGTLVTLNLKAALVVGYILEFGVGILLARVYERFTPGVQSTPLARGAVYGLALWALLMTVGLPLFSVASPLVTHGLLLSPGFFAWHFGLATTLLLLVSLLMYGMTVGYLLDSSVLRPRPS
jgi:hypothetical protein